jgi:hypothetical protein
VFPNHVGVPKIQKITLLQTFQKSNHTASTDNITDEGPCQAMIFTKNIVVLMENGYL